MYDILILLQRSQYLKKIRLFYEGMSEIYIYKEVILLKNR